MNEAYSQDGNRVKHRARRSDDFLLPAPKAHTPLVKPGRYVGVTTRVIKRSYRGARDYLVIYFDLWASAEAMGDGEVPVGRGIPGFFNLSTATGSNYSKLLRLLFPGSAQQRPSSDLIGKALLVNVVDVKRDGEQYSRVASEGLARA